MVYCENCGSEIDDDTEFCPNCGFSIKQEFIPANQVFVSKNRGNAFVLSLIGLILSIVNIPLSIYYYFDGVANAKVWLPRAIEIMSSIDTTYAPYLDQWSQEYITTLYNRLMSDVSIFAYGSIVFLVSSILGFISVYLFYNKKDISFVSFTISGIINLVIGLYFITFTRTIGKDTIPYYVNEFHIVGVISLIAAIIVLDKKYLY